MTVVAHILTSLPPEILLLISEHLTAHELVRLSRTCRTLRHFGDCKSIAKALIRLYSADAAISLYYETLNRMDILVELFRRVHDKDRDYCYFDVSCAAARLNDIKQLKAWRAEFGYYSIKALVGAAQSGRIETFDFVFSRIPVDDDTYDFAFEKLGEKGDRAMLEHLRTKYPQIVAPERLETAMEYAAANGHLDFALDAFDSLPIRSGKVIITCAGHVTYAAAAKGNFDIFSEFIEMFQYSNVDRNCFAAAAAARNNLDILRHQEGTDNYALSLGKALNDAVNKNAVEAVQFLMENESSNGFRITGDQMFDALLSAMAKRHTEMASLMITRVPHSALLHAAVASKSLEEAMVFLRQFLRFEDQHRYAEPRKITFEANSANVPDWMLAIWLVITCINLGAPMDKSFIDHVDRARYLGIIPIANELARELGDYTSSKVSNFIKFTLKI